MSDPWPSVARAAELLHLHPTRVRQLIAAGRLHAVKVGRDWAVEPASLERLRATERLGGRPLAPAHAWALLWHASSDPRLQALASGWLQPWAASRVRRALEAGDWRARLPLLRRRADLHHLRAHPSDLDRLAAEPDFLPTGVSAAQAHGLDIVAPGVVEGYVPAGRLAALRDRYLLEPSDRPNVVLHVVGSPWPFPPTEPVAPAIAAAVELADSDDPRTRRAGLAYLEALDTAGLPRRRQRA